MMPPRTLPGRASWFTIIGSVMTALLVVALPEANALLSSSGGYSFNGTETCFMKKINNARQSHGLRRLDWDKQVGYIARRHARRMARNQAVWHSQTMDDQITRWRRLAQNVGGGGGCRVLFRAFMRSSEHRHNILGSWQHMGVGTEWGGGRLYVQQIFESRRDPGNVYHYP